MTALKIYDEIAKENGVTDDLNAVLIQKINFAREQTQQMKAIVNRLIFDMTMTKVRLNDSKDEETQSAYKDKYAQYAKDLRQTRDGLKIANQLVKELESQLKED